MTEKVPVDNETRQFRAGVAGIAITIISIFFAFAGCEAHSHTNPPASRCLYGTILVKVDSGWGCAPISERGNYSHE